MRPIMFVGTGSDVGKSILTTGLCRIFKQDGLHPAPFKAQNMSLNSYATSQGEEIGRAQAVQAEACGVPCDTRMNPVLLKPTSHQSSQVILHGKPIGNQSAKEYFLGNNKENLFNEAKKAFDSLSKTYVPIVMEGAGSISELNLKHRDIVNMRMAKHANADVYLVADIDKGGVFASVYGTIALLEDWERILIKGIIINKFRGDISLFNEGRKKIEKLTQIPVIGVVPFAQDIYIEDEDSVALKTKSTTVVAHKINIAVVLLPHISNYTDFNILERDERVNLFYSKNASEIAKADITILPGTKNTLSDLHFLRTQGLASAILSNFKKHKKVIGICGGYQMMGDWVKDPHGVEGTLTELPGLGILPIKTTLTKEKKTVQQNFFYRNQKQVCKGYEIHMGITEFEQQTPLTTLENNTQEGYWLNKNCWGTYIHGILDNAVVIDDLLESVSTEKRLSHQEFKEKNYDLLADHLRNCLDINYIYTQNKRNEW